MGGETVLGKAQAAQLVTRPGVSLILGYHPRANIDLLLDVCVSTVRKKLRSMVVDCDHTVSLDFLESPLEKSQISKILLSHPEDVGSLERDLKACIAVEDGGSVALNRPSSLIAQSDLIRKFEEKKRMWRLIYSSIKGLAKGAPVLILEDSRRGDRIEYRVHPALYYLSGVILDAVEDGKRVEQYRIIKKRPSDA